MPRAVPRTPIPLVQYLEMAAKIQRCVDTRNILIETKRRHKEEQDLLQRMQLEQKLKLMQQQVRDGGLARHTKFGLFCSCSFHFHLFRLTDGAALDFVLLDWFVRSCLPLSPFVSLLGLSACILCCAFVPVLAGMRVLLCSLAWRHRH